MDREKGICFPLNPRGRPLREIQATAVHGRRPRLGEDRGSVCSPFKLPEPRHCPVRDFHSCKSEEAAAGIVHRNRQDATQRRHSYDHIRTTAFGNSGVSTFARNRTLSELLSDPLI